ncbi:MAG: hypothetical protein ACOX3H_06835 [Saccharofermentanales bacterium]|jgi:hypothetical protein
MNKNTLIGMALNQQIQWQRYEGTNDYGQPQYEAVKEIDCRISYQTKLVINKNGEEVKSNAMITTLEPVGISDRLIIDGRDFIVIDVKAPVTFSGHIHRRKAYI